MLTFNYVMHSLPWQPPLKSTSLKINSPFIVVNAKGGLKQGFLAISSRTCDSLWTQGVGVKSSNREGGFCSMSILYLL